MEWFSTLTLALGSAWTSGINLYATVAVLGALQKFGATKLPGGLDVLDNWWIIGFAAGLVFVGVFAGKKTHAHTALGVGPTFIRIPAGVVVAYSATNEMDPSFYIPAALLGGGLTAAAHTTKSALRVGANLSPEPVSNWALSIVEDVIAFVGALLAVFAPIIIAGVLAIFVLAFFYFFPKIFRAVRRMLRAIKAFFAGEKYDEAALR